MGCSMTLMGLNFSQGDKVVTTNHEHNAIRSPLQVLQARQGLKVETQSFPPTDKLNGMGSIELIDTLFPNTPALQGAKALCVSHVYPTTGVRLPLRLLREKADELGIRYLVVDGAQAMGMVDLGKDGDNIDNCDFYACPGHKWLNGPPSTGVLYIKNADIRPPEFYPTISQRMGKYVDCSDASGECFPMAKTLQVRGCSNTPGFAAMVGAMKYVVDAGGAAQVERHILALSQEVKRFILSRAPDSIVSPHTDPALQSGLTTFYPFHWDKPQSIFQDKKSADWVVTELLKKNIQVRSIGVPSPISPGGKSETRYVIRVSTGFFNTAAEVELFKTALQEVLTRIS
jgi:isopenicillin-N epimerase